MNNTTSVFSNRDNTSGLSVDIPSKFEGIICCSVFVSASALIVTGNMLTIFLFVGNRRLRKESLFLVVNMAVADLMLGAASLPLYIYVIDSDFYELWTRPMDIYFDYLFVIADNVPTVASLTSATCISCERFYAIYRPFKHRTLTVRTYLIVILMVWTIAAVDTVLIYITRVVGFCKHYYYYWLSFGLISTAVICGCNIAIWRKFQQGTVAGTKHQNNELRNKRLTKTLLFVSLLALFCWLPFITLMSFVILADVNLPWRYYVAVAFGNYSNAFVNPIVYLFRIPKFRQALDRSVVRRRATVKVENFEIGVSKTAALTKLNPLRTLEGDLKLDEDGRDTSQL